MASLHLASEKETRRLRVLHALELLDTARFDVLDPVVLQSLQPAQATWHLAAPALTAAVEKDAAGESEAARQGAEQPDDRRTDRLYDSLVQITVEAWSLVVLRRIA